MVVLKSVSASDLESVLEFLYLGRVSVGQERLNSFLKTANELKIKGLSDDDDKRKNKNMQENLGKKYENISILTTVN